MPVHSIGKYWPTFLIFSFPKNRVNSYAFVKWILHSVVVANALSGATQLLLLAHTPVSRKVFLYFHCHEIAGRTFLRADYDIDCKSDAYYLYMPFVVVVLVGFTILLPAIILLYLFRHRNDLYSTRTHQRIGWLCEFLDVLWFYVLVVDLFWKLHLDLVITHAWDVKTEFLFCFCLKDSEWLESVSSTVISQFILLGLFPP